MDEQEKFNINRYRELSQAIRMIDDNYVMGQIKTGDYFSKNDKEKQKALEPLREIQRIKNLYRKLEDAHKEIMLFREFDSYVRRSYQLSNTDGAYMLETSIYQKNQYFKLKQKEYHELRRSIDPMSDMMYDLIKKHLRYNVGMNSEKESYTLGYLMERKFNFRIYSGKDINNIVSRGIEDKDTILRDNGIKKDDLNDLINTIKDTNNPKSSLLVQHEKYYDQLENIRIAKKEGFKVPLFSKSLHDLESKYIELIDVARETWYLENLLQIFGNSNIIKSSEDYKKLFEIYNEQKEDLSKKFEKLEREYNKTDIVPKLEALRTLDKLSKEIEELFDLLVRYNQDLDRYTDDQRFEVRRQIEAKKDAMRKIIERNKGFIKIETYSNILNKAESKMFNSKNSSVISEVNNNREKYTSMIKEGNSYAGEPMPFPQDNHKQSTSYGSNMTDNYDNITNKEDNRRIDEDTRRLLNESSTERTRCYTNYNRMKLENKIDDYMSFSEFIEEYHPSYERLIMIEKKREELAEEFYEEYINSGSTDNFENYMKNTEGVSKFDVPVGAELKKGKSR